MTKNEFLKKLEEALNNNRATKNKPNMVSEVLADYQEHFAYGLQSGKTEDEICFKLGDPVVIAKAYETEEMIAEIKNPDQPFHFPTALNILGRLMILAPFNFFMLLIPGTVIISLLIAGWSVIAGLFASSLGIFSFSIIASLLSISYWLGIAITSTCLALLGVSILFSFFMFFLSKQFILACINYLQWNLKFILQKQ